MNDGKNLFIHGEVPCWSTERVKNSGQAALQSQAPDSFKLVSCNDIVEMDKTRIHWQLTPNLVCHNPNSCLHYLECVTKSWALFDLMIGDFALDLNIPWGSVVLKRTLKLKDSSLCRNFEGTDLGLLTSKQRSSTVLHWLFLAWASRLGAFLHTCHNVQHEDCF